MPFDYFKNLTTEPVAEIGEKPLVLVKNPPLKLGGF